MAFGVVALYWWGEGIKKYRVPFLNVKYWGCEGGNRNEFINWGYLVDRFVCEKARNWLKDG